MKYLLLLLGVCLAPLTPAFSSSESEEELVINNRILTTAHGKAISVLDVVKQMDVFLHQYYPEYLESEEARLRFYSAQWKPTLERMINYELMMADAESRKIGATDGEVREEIQNRYGPNVMTSLDQLGLTYDEARKMVHQELVVQKIQWLRVTSKVLAKVTTELLRKTYDQHIQENRGKEVWAYQFITFRCETLEESQSFATQVMSFQESASGALAAAVDLFKQKIPQEKWSTLSVSSEFQLEDQDLSSAHRDVLTQLSIGSWSHPTIQQSRDGSQVVRIFQLKDHTEESPPPFEKIAPQLKEQILNKFAQEEMEKYLSHLHQRFGDDQTLPKLPPQFDPFAH